MADTLSLQEPIANPTAYPVTHLGQTMHSIEEPLLRTRTGETSGPPSAQTPSFSPLSRGRHLLVGVDDSEYSIEALKFAFIGYAKEGDRMTVVKAISPLPGQFGPTLPGDYRRDVGTDATISSYNAGPRFISLFDSQKMIELYEEVGKIRIEVGAERIPYRVDIRYGDPREILIEAVRTAIHGILIALGSNDSSAHPTIVSQNRSTRPVSLLGAAADPA
ncbi:hypothetical protein SpCBS45565_g02829 [Spizellomyces sp. 'palustris']|nr:hypothetical protein SpCBS45565_g02829 [Spizellomyces sp. 'palustris']